MNRLTIKNIGPIKDVSIDIKKLNVIMGPQSSGKSTIAKILDYCHYVEKQYCLFRKDKYIFQMQMELESHYKMSGFFNLESYIKYESYYLTIELVKGSGFIYEKDGFKNYGYRRAKNIYIPAERCIATTFKSWERQNLDDSYIRSYLQEWERVRWEYAKGKMCRINAIGMSYYFDSDANKDMISCNNSPSLLLESTSSGVQAVTPLSLMFNAYKDMNNDIYKKDSPSDQVTLSQIYSDVIFPRTASFNGAPMPKTEKFNYKDYTYLVPLGETNMILQMLKNYMETQYMCAIVEEPELNLFPDSQQALIYDMLKDIAHSNNELIITTHSPYVLFAVNNCILGGLVGKNIPDSHKEKFESAQSWIDRSDVDLLEIKDGKLRKIQDNDGLLLDNYLNGAYKKISNEYLNLLNYYGN